MKFIKISASDPDIYMTQPTPVRCNFVSNHFEAFMQMYKSQGSTFWLRFLISFKAHTEDKYCETNQWLSLLMQHFNFIKVLNYVYISIHKKFIEGSNTAVKKLINNLIVLTTNAPNFLLKNDSSQWLSFIKNSKQLHTTFQNLFGSPEPTEFSALTAFLYSIYTEFFSALCAVFEQWCNAKDLTEDEMKKVDTKLIYWLPPFDKECEMNPLCFEKYLSNYYKENLQRVLMTDHIHDVFSAHKVTGCCDKFDKEKNIFKVFDYAAVLETERLLQYSEECHREMHTVTETCMKDICILKPQVAVCNSHKECFVRICHGDKCDEPFLCRGENPCVLTCETKMLSNVKKQKKKNFWKTVSAELFPIDKQRCNASTQAESNFRDIETYLHLRKSSDFDMMPISMMNAYQCVAEFHNFDINPRKTECLNRLRKKLSQKHPSAIPIFNPSALRQTFYRESLLEKANEKMTKMQEQYCIIRGHDMEKCQGKCFFREANTVAVSSANACGRVVAMSKISLSVPSDLNSMRNECCCHPSVSSDCKKIELSKSSEIKKSNKSRKKAKANESKLVSENRISPEHFNGSENATKDLKEEKPEDEEESEINIDDDIDEICKLIGIGENGDDASAVQSADFEQAYSNSNCTEASSKNEQLVDDFLDLIGVDLNHFDESPSIVSETECLDKGKLKTCAYCKKKETRRKMFKKCSMCKEVNFPVHQYYCSEECLMEDWVESHEAEHLRFKKILLRN